MNRPRLLRSAFALAFSSLAILPATSGQAAGERAPSVVPAAVAPQPRTESVTASRDWTPGRWAVYLTNQERRSRGLAALKIADAPRTAAYWQSKYQASTRTMSHTGPGGSDAGDRLTRLGYPWKFWAENVAAGQTTATQVVRAWMNSPGHRAAMLRPDARHIGVARKISGSGVPYWTMVITNRYY